MKKIDWNIVVPVMFGIVALTAVIIAIANGAGVDPITGMRIVMYNTKMTIIP